MALNSRRQLEKCISRLKTPIRDLFHLRLLIRSSALHSPKPSSSSSSGELDMLKNALARPNLIRESLKMSSRSQSADHWHIDGLVDVPVAAVREHLVQELHLWNLHHPRQEGQPWRVSLLLQLLLLFVTVHNVCVSTLLIAHARASRQKNNADLEAWECAGSRLPSTHSNPMSNLCHHHHHSNPVLNMNTNLVLLTQTPPLWVSTSLFQTNLV